MDAVGVLFPMRVGEVAQENDSGAGFGIGDDACAREACFAEGAGRNVGAHELCRVQFPAEGGAGRFAGGFVHGAGEGCEFRICESVVAHHLEDAGGRDSARFLLRTFGEPVIQHRLHEFEQVRYATEHSCAPHGEELAQYPGAFVVDFSLDFSIAESADFCGHDFRFFDAVEVAR